VWQQYEGKLEILTAVLQIISAYYVADIVEIGQRL